MRTVSSGVACAARYHAATAVAGSAVGRGTGASVGTSVGIGVGPPNPQAVTSVRQPASSARTTKRTSVFGWRLVTGYAGNNCTDIPSRNHGDHQGMPGVPATLTVGVQMAP